MRGGAILARFLSHEGGEAAEFALVLPLSMLLFFGLIDAGRFAYAFNQGEKATQIGARWAVVTDPLAPELTTTSYVGVTVGGQTLTQGDRIPAAALGEISCTTTTCTCVATPCPAGVGTADTAAADLMLARMQQFMPEITAANLEVDYTGSGLGYAGNPNGMDIAPFVTVKLKNMTFSPFVLFGKSVSLPDFSYTLTMEDGSGQDAY